MMSKNLKASLKEIHQFVDDLEALTNSAEVATERIALIREELKTLTDPEDLRLIKEASKLDDEEWSDAASVALGNPVDSISQDKRITDWSSTMPKVQWAATTY